MFRSTDLLPRLRQSQRLHIGCGALALGGVTLVGCSSGDTIGASNGETAEADSPAAAPSNSELLVDATPGAGGTKPTSDRPIAVVEETLPNGFTAGTVGGFFVVGTVADFDEEPTNACKNVLRGIVRDFTWAHTDFGGSRGGLMTGLVQEQVSDLRKPVPSGDPSKEWAAGEIDEWYENDAGGNVPYVFDLWLEPDEATGLFVFDSDRFFPLDAYGTEFHNDQDNVERNFLFTSEIHTAFEYKGGEVFAFRGDDDVFVFIGGHLAVDLGGVHGPEEESIDLDAFATTAGLVKGEVYNLDLFHAERNPSGSNFRIETSLDFKECGLLEQDVTVK